jgi:hypothetical protein
MNYQHMLLSKNIRSLLGVTQLAEDDIDTLESSYRHTVDIHTCRAGGAAVVQNILGHICNYSLCSLRQKLQSLCTFLHYFISF